MIINYFLADDTLSVFEPVVRNSGMKGGTFLNRMRYKKHITPKVSFEFLQLVIRNQPGLERNLGL